MAEKTEQKKNSQDVNLKTSTVNLTLNIVIFLLAALIIYMAFSIFVKIGGNDRSVPAKTNTPVASDIIQVEVLNGCGVAGVADRFTDYLRNNSFDVVKMTNYITFDVNKSMVIDRRNNMANAYKVAQSLGISRENVIQQLNDDYFLDVSVVIGKDYFNLKPLK